MTDLNPLTHCPFRKHRGESWEDVLEEDRRYMEWLVSGEGPDLGQELYDTLMDLLEEA